MSLSTKELASERIGEYLQGALWHRTLWRLGTLLELRELLEAWQARSDGVLSKASVDYLKTSTLNRVRRDIGLHESSRELAGLISKPLLPGSHPRLALEEILPGLEARYLRSWRSAIAARDNVPGEALSRATATHLLGRGFSSRFLRQAWYQPNRECFDDLLDLAIELGEQAPSTFEIVVPVVAGHHVPDVRAESWMSSTQTKSWIETRVPGSTLRIEQSGALRLRLTAMDKFSALEDAVAAVTRIEARLKLGSRNPPRLGPEMFVAGDEGAHSREEVSRPVHVRSVQKESLLFQDELAFDLDIALEMALPLHQGHPYSAITGSWAALETLLSGPGDDSKALVAKRIARVVACSYVRAELTSLANAYKKDHKDELSSQLRDQSTNLDRARTLENALREQRRLASSFQFHGHTAAFRRMRRLVQDPARVMPRIVGQLEDAFARLYRQRNLMSHAGTIQSVALKQTLFTIGPLVGAGLDRLVFASSGLQTAMQTSAQAQVGLEFRDVAKEPVALVDLLTHSPVGRETDLRQV